MNKLSQQKCIPCEGGVNPLTNQEVDALLLDTSGWEYHQEASQIMREFKFKNYYKTMAFVNAVAYMAHQENHHPDMEVGYNHCLIKFSTHAIGGLSQNDFICAAKVNEIAQV